MQETWVCSLGQEDPLEKGMATHFSVTAWRIPWTEESGRLQSMVLQRVGHNWVTNTLWEAYWFFSVVGNISLETSKSFLSLPLSLPDSLSLFFWPSAFLSPSLCAVLNFTHYVWGRSPFHWCSEGTLIWGLRCLQLRFFFLHFPPGSSAELLLKFLDLSLALGLQAFHPGLVCVQIHTGFSPWLLSTIHSVACPIPFQDSFSYSPFYPLQYSWTSLVAQLVKSLPAMWPGFNPWVGKIPRRRERLPTPVFCPREFHGL